MARLSRKVKTALDETRMLMLGAHILLGFELRGAFAETFDELPAPAYWLYGAGLGLMVVVVGLLIAPGTYHRIVERGADSEQFHAVVTDLADLALLPFALAIGIAISLAAVRIYGPAAGWASGLATALLALGLWYGLPLARRRALEHSRPAVTQPQTPHPDKPAGGTPLHIRLEHLLTEARMILPGAQALLGFQLSIVLTRSFDRLPPLSIALHAVSTLFVALAVMLLMAPPAYHRIVFDGQDSEDVYRVSSGLIAAATAPLALGLAGDLYVVIALIGGPAIGLAAGLSGFALLVGLWYGYPLAVAARRRRPEAAARSATPKAQRQSG